MVEIAIIILMLVLSAFFSGMEIAYVSSNKIHIELEKRQEDITSRVLKILTAHPSRFIVTMLIGNSIALVVYGFQMGDLLTELLVSEFPALSDTSLQLLFLQTLISTLVILLTAEFLPKVFFQIYANQLLKFFAIPALIFYVLFYPVSWFCLKVSDTLLRSFFKTGDDEIQLSFSKIELGDYITEQMESSNETEEVDAEIQIFQNALDFSNVKSREVMVPRTEMVSMPEQSDLKELRKKITDTGLSKILIHKETIDDVIGYVHSFDLFRAPEKVQDILRQVEYIPETMLVRDVLNQLTKKRKSIAIVMDEYGGTSGMITVEDIVEELVGDIQDEHDTDLFIETELEGGRYKFSARLEVDYINETYGLELPDEENYETIGGLIVHHTEGFPEEGERITIEGYWITILETSENKIDLVEIERRGE